MDKNAKIFIAGHRGMVGSAILRALKKNGYSNFVLKTSSELDLRNQDSVANFFKTNDIDYVFLAAAKVGGIIANSTYRADFIYDNLMIQTNVIHHAYLNNIKKLLLLGSSCIYPKMAPQPLKEEFLLTGYLEPSNEPYAIAKIAGIKMCDAYRKQYGCNFISVMPTNLYGPNDNYDLNTSHVLPALLRKFNEAKINGAKSVTIWGSGAPLREFMHSDDLADACLFLMDNFDEEGFVNIGVGEDISIMNLSKLIQKIVGFNGTIITDNTKPDGTPRKLLDVSKLNSLGWKAKISLEVGVKKVYEEIKNIDWSI
jgi:GDP-L-fucose synthase